MEYQKDFIGGPHFQRDPVVLRAQAAVGRPELERPGSGNSGPVVAIEAQWSCRKGEWLPSQLPYGGRSEVARSASSVWFDPYKFLPQPPPGRGGGANFGPKRIFGGKGGKYPASVRLGPQASLPLKDQGNRGDHAQIRGQMGKQRHQQAAGAAADLPPQPGRRGQDQKGGADPP